MASASGNLAGLSVDRGVVCTAADRCHVAAPRSSRRSGRRRVDSSATGPESPAVIVAGGPVYGGAYAVTVPPPASRRTRAVAVERHREGPLIPVVIVADGAVAPIGHTVTVAAGVSATAIILVQPDRHRIVQTANASAHADESPVTSARRFCLLNVPGRERDDVSVRRRGEPGGRVRAPAGAPAPR